MASMPPSADRDDAQPLKADNNQKIVKVLGKAGISSVSKIEGTLQGSVWRGSLSRADEHSACPVVVKVANRYLHEHSLAEVGLQKQRVTVHENIISEAQLLKFLTKDQQQCSQCIVKFIDIFKTRSDYFLVMEDGGQSLFDFIVQCHEFIQCGRIKIAHWQNVVKTIFQQMLESVRHIHSHNVCHHDISMENFVINDVLMKISEDGGGYEFLIDSIQVKLCDFGLAERFEDDECLCTKWCGKQKYKSPEVMAKRRAFSAKKNDIWCLAVCLFMMSTGYPPWQSARESDDSFAYIYNGGDIKHALKLWGLLRFVDDWMLRVFRCVFQEEATRGSIAEIERHLLLDNQQ